MKYVVVPNTIEDIEIYKLPVLATLPIYEENLAKNKKGGKKR